MTEPQQPPSAGQITSSSPESLGITVSNVYANVSQEVIVVTHDKAKLCLLEHAGKMEKKSAWVAPASVVLTVLAALVTTDFKAAFGVPPDAWHTLFIAGLIAAVIWLLISLKDTFRSVSVDDVLADLKSQSPGAPTSPPSNSRLSNLRLNSVRMNFPFVGLDMGFGDAARDQGRRAPPSTSAAASTTTRPQIAEDPALNAFEARMIALAKVNPLLAVKAAWLEVRKEITEALRRVVLPANMPITDVPRSDIQMLRDNDYIDRETSRVLTDLVRYSEQVERESDAADKVTYSDAIDYAARARQMIQRLANVNLRK